jgi:hypothetical protein
LKDLQKTERKRNKQRSKLEIQRGERERENTARKVNGKEAG